MANKNNKNAEQRVHNRFGGMRVKTGAGCGNFNNQRERDFLFFGGWDARIVKEK